MKLSNEALLEIVNIIQEALIGNTDASDALRNLDLVEDLKNNKLTLSPDYTRAGVGTTKGTR